MTKVSTKTEDFLKYIDVCNRLDQINKNLERVRINQFIMEAEITTLRSILFGTIRADNKSTNSFYAVETIKTYWDLLGETVNDILPENPNNWKYSEEARNAIIHILDEIKKEYDNVENNEEHIQ